MNQQSRHDRSIVSIAVAPLAFPFLEGGSPYSTTFFFDGAQSSWFLICLSCGASLLLGGVLARWAKTLVPKRSCNGSEAHNNLTAAPACSENIPRPTLQGSDDRAKLVQRFLDQGRIAILLRPQIARTLEEEHFTVIQQLFQRETAFISGGEIGLIDWSFEETDPAPNQAARHRVEVDAFYLDRTTITNRQFQEFVADGGYGQQSLWDAAIWPRVNEFVDHTGTAGPRYWNHGAFLPGDGDRPVVGVSWYEADAFARWAGRRLPSDAEWVKAAVCPNSSLGQDTIPKKFPWGDNFEPQRANVWISGIGCPVSSAGSQTSRTKDEIVQLIGNVWEWTTCDVKITSYGRDVRFELTLKSLRGGAFDTYFENQATCQLQSGDSPLARRRNVGFRCALAATDVIDFGGPA